jgi:hypothetical protein
MPLVKNVEKRIWDREGFDVRIKDRSNRDIRSDMKGLPMYPFKIAATNNTTVYKWKHNRFYKNYHGYRVDVLDGNGDSCSGNTKLETVRDSYYEE